LFSQRREWANNLILVDGFWNAACMGYTPLLAFFLPLFYSVLYRLLAFLCVCLLGRPTYDVTMESTSKIYMVEFALLLRILISLTTLNCNTASEDIGLTAFVHLLWTVGLGFCLRFVDNLGLANRIMVYLDSQSLAYSTHV